MRFLRIFFSHWQNWLAVVVILGFAAMALAAPMIAPENPKRPGPFPRLSLKNQPPRPPSAEAPLGTFSNSVDVFHPLVWGARDALQFGLSVALSALIFGTLYGAVAGFIGGRGGSWMISIADAFLAFPVIAGVVFLQQLLATTITAMGGFYYYSQANGRVIEIVGPPTPIQWLLDHVNPLMFALIVLSWMPYARLIYSTVLSLMQMPFVMAARMVGGSSWWILRKHLIPNAFAPVLILAARDIGGMVIVQTTFTFINIGGDSVWGEMLVRGKDWVIGPGGSLFTYWWVYLPATLAIMAFSVSWNMFGDGLVDALDPEASVPIKKARRHNREMESREPAVLSSPSQFPRTAMSPGVLTSLPRRSPGDASPVWQSSESDPVFRAARDALAAHNLEGSLHAYSHLIARNRQVDEVIHDLIQVARQFPDYAPVWKMLGDALTRANNHEYAAKAYAHFAKMKH